MNSSNPFDHGSLIYKLMKYLYKVQEQMEKVHYVWIIIDVIQFSTIITSLLGYVIKKHFNILQEDLFDNFLNIFFNYSKIYDWLVISGACSAFIVILGLLTYLYVQFKKQVREETKLKVLQYCALIGTIVLGLFEIFSQVMANNLINIVTKILNRSLSMDVTLIGFFLLNMGMMVFISLFNSRRRIFRFSLVIVSLGLNMFPFTLTCFLLTVLSLYYQSLDKIIYKKLFYFLIIATCLWSSFQILDGYDYLLTARLIYLSFACCAFLLYFYNYQRQTFQFSQIQENRYLVQLFKKRTKKQDKRQDYLMADQIFINYFTQQNQNKNILKKDLNYDFYMTTSAQQWHESDYREKVIEKIKFDRLKNPNDLENQISYYEFLVQLKTNMVELLNQVFNLMSQRKNDSLYTIYQINRLTNQIQKQFKKNVQNEESVLKISEIIFLEQLYKNYYDHYSSIVTLLQTIFQNLQLKNGLINESTQQKLVQFSLEQKILLRTLQSIKNITGNKLQYTLYRLLSQIWDKYDKKQQSLIEQNKYDKDIQQQQLLKQSKQKYDFSYLVLSNHNISYASIKFLSWYSYKESYIVGQNFCNILPNNFNLYMINILERNAQKKIFQSQIPIINQKGMFQIVNGTFYLLPQFKGEIAYILKITRIPELQLKNLILFNCQTFCIEGFNKRMVSNFKFSIQKINSILNTRTIQFSDLFVINNQEKDLLILANKSNSSSFRGKRVVDTQSFNLSNIQKYKEDKSRQIKALMKIQMLSIMKKAFSKNVVLQGEVTFQIQNITYKIIKIEESIANKTHDTVSQKQKTEQINLLKHMKTEGGLIYTTKDLKKKYLDQMFFCPISNPYRPRILQKINSLTKSSRVSIVFLIKLFFSTSLLVFLGGSIGFKISTSNIYTQIQQFQRQASSFNRQYTFFMQGIFYAYYIHHVQLNPVEFKQYFQELKKPNNIWQTQKLSVDEIYNRQVQILNIKKVQSLKKFQSSYFDYPIIYDQTPVYIQLKTQYFTLKGYSNTTIIADIMMYLVNTTKPFIKQMIAQNYVIFTKLIQILRPDGRYQDKIQSLNRNPLIILIVSIIIIVFVFSIIYVLLYQLRDAREDIITMYTLIQKKQLVKNKKKLQQIQDLIQTLSNSKKLSKTSRRNSTFGQQYGFQTLSQINSTNNINSTNQLLMPNQIDSFKSQSKYDLNSFGQNQDDNFILKEDKLQDDPNQKNSIKKNKDFPQQKLNVLIETVIKNYTYLVIFLSVFGILGFQFYSSSIYGDNYTQTFSYFEKLRAANFQFRYLYVNAQRYSFYATTMLKPYQDPSIPINASQKKTHFQYEIPQGFTIRQNQSLCSDNNLNLIDDPLLVKFNCNSIDEGILSHEFSQAYEKFERNLRLITNLTYSQLISPTYRQSYIATIYEFNVFKNYFDNLLQTNFLSNISAMNQKLESELNYQIIASIVFIIISLFIMFCYSFVKLQNQLDTLISLIKMIPSETMFSMKVAAFIKKRKILEKLNKL